jgi:alpha-ketoglutaric semialdehyde dehydrogenase
MLNQSICKTYSKGIGALKSIQGVAVLASSSKESNPGFNEGRPTAFTVKAETFLSNKQLSDEVFGPTTLFVLCKDLNELHTVLHSMEGQLTATVHASESDEENLKEIINLITEKAGRVIYNGFPTGVEVGHAMQHGGPFPSTTDSRSTSVGTAAIYRFLRPVAFQDIPDHLLPEPLKNANPLNIPRLVDGKWTTDKIQ